MTQLRRGFDRRRSAGRRMATERRRDDPPVSYDRRGGAERRSPPGRRLGSERRLDERHAWPWEPGPEASWPPWWGEA